MDRALTLGEDAVCEFTYVMLARSSDSSPNKDYPSAKYCHVCIEGTFKVEKCYKKSSPTQSVNADDLVHIPEIKLYGTQVFAKKCSGTDKDPTTVL